jgi:hypothetical protein
MEGAWNRIERIDPRCAFRVCTNVSGNAFFVAFEGRFGNDAS